MVLVKTEIKIPEMKIPVELEIPGIAAPPAPPTEFIKPLEIKPLPPAPPIAPTTEDTFKKLGMLIEKLKPLAEKGLELVRKAAEKLKERRPVREKEIEEVVGKEKRGEVKKIFEELGIPVISEEEEKALTEKEKIALRLGIPVYSSEVTMEKAAKAL